MCVGFVAACRKMHFDLSGLYGAVERTNEKQKNIYKWAPSKTDNMVSEEKIRKIKGEEKKIK